MLIYPEYLENIDSAYVVIENAISRIVDNKIQEGLYSLKPYFPVSPIVLDNLIFELSNKWQIATSQWGKFIKIEHVFTNMLGESFVRIGYFAKYELSAQSFLIKMYKPDTKWFLTGFSTNSDFNFND